MAVNPNEDTEFNDALRKHGILPPREPTPPSPSPPASPTLEDLLEDFTPSELQEISADAGDDETERTIARIRRLRLAEMRKERKLARFGEVYPIGRDDYTREVTDASKVDEEEDEEEKGTGVVCFLYKDGIPHCDRAFIHVRTLAARHPRTKFVSIIGDKCIPNLPDVRLPMFIIYRKGEIRNQISSWGADRERSLEELEVVLILSEAIIAPDRPPPQQRKAEEEDELEEEDDEAPRRSAATSTNGRPAKNIRGPVRHNEEDSDSDLDL